MTAATAHPLQSTQGAAESRPPEPSMEDILASIRRIISDDQFGHSRAAPAQAASAVPAPAAEPAAVPAPVREADHPYATAAAPVEPSDPPPSAVPPANASAAAPRPATRAAPPVLTPVARTGAEPPMPQDVEDSWHRDNDAKPEPQVAVEPPTAHNAPVVFRSRFSGSPGSAPQAARTVPASGPAEHGEERPSANGSKASEQLLSPPLGASVTSAFETLAASVVLRNADMLENTMRELLRPLLRTWLDDHLPTLVERLVRAEIERVARGGHG